MTRYRITLTPTDDDGPDTVSDSAVLCLHLASRELHEVKEAFAVALPKPHLTATLDELSERAERAFPGCALEIVRRDDPDEGESAEAVIYTGRTVRPSLGTPDEPTIFACDWGDA